MAYKSKLYGEQLETAILAVIEKLDGEHLAEATDETSGLMSAEDKKKLASALANIVSLGTKTDDITNTLQKIGEVIGSIRSGLQGKVNKTTTINGKAINDGVVLDGGDIKIGAQTLVDILNNATKELNGKVPATRTVNGKELTRNIEIYLQNLRDLYSGKYLPALLDEKANSADVKKSLAGKASSVSKVAVEDGKGGVKEVDDDTNAAITNLSYDVFNLSRSTENKANLNSQGVLATGEEQRLVVDFVNIDGKHIEVNIPGVYYNGSTKHIETYKRHGEGMMSIVQLELSEEPSVNVVYCDKAENKLYRWNGTAMVQVGGGGGSIDAYTKEETDERFAAKADLTAGRIAVDGFENLQEQLDNTVLFSDYPKKVNRIYIAGVVKVNSASGLTVDNDGFISVDMVQTTGTATDKVMSQKAVSNLIGDVESLLSTI